MGAGVAKSQSDVNCSHSRISSSAPSSCSVDMSACEACAIRFSLLKRKKSCCECGKYHCSGCLTKSPATNGVRRRCQKCQLLVSGRFTRADLMDYKVKELRQFLTRRNVAINNCTEKADLVEALLRFNNSSQYRLEQDENNRRMQQLQQQREDQLRQEQQQEQQQQQAPPPQRRGSRRDAEEGDDDDNVESAPDPIVRNNPPSYADVMSATAATSTTSEQEEMDVDENHFNAEDNLPAAVPSSSSQEAPSSSSTAAPGRQRARIEHIERLEGVDELTVLQLKEVLATSYVDYRGCVEKWELRDRVCRLWKDTTENKRKAEELEKEEHHGGGTGDTELCKICMEGVIDCVLLECGHMVTCTSCGKQMSECPICRQYVVRVVHVFK